MHTRIAHIVLSDLGVSVPFSALTSPPQPVPTSSQASLKTRPSHHATHCLYSYASSLIPRCDKQIGLTHVNCFVFRRMQLETSTSFFQTMRNVTVLPAVLDQMCAVDEGACGNKMDQLASSIVKNDACEYSP